MKQYFIPIVCALAFFGLAGLFFYRTYIPPSHAGLIDGTFGKVSLKIEVADTPKARERGLSKRLLLPPEQAMLFVFPDDGYYGFWMKDMMIPIDIFWLDSEGRVVSVEKDVLPSSYPTSFYPTSPARYVLETNTGFAALYSIGTGTPLLLKSFPIVSE